MFPAAGPTACLPTPTHVQGRVENSWELGEKYLGPTQGTYYHLLSQAEQSPKMTACNHTHRAQDRFLLCYLSIPLCGHLYIYLFLNLSLPLSIHLLSCISDHMSHLGSMVPFLWTSL